MWQFSQFGRLAGLCCRTSRYGRMGKIGNPLTSPDYLFPRLCNKALKNGTCFRKSRYGRMGKIGNPLTSPDYLFPRLCNKALKNGTSVQEVAPEEQAAALRNWF